MIPLGRYQHFKGGLYQVTHLARDSENEEWQVVYYPLYGNIESNGQPEYWVRALSMFDETIEREGKTIKRFTYVGQ